MSRYSDMIQFAIGKISSLEWPDIQSVLNEKKILLCSVGRDTLTLTKNPNYISTIVSILEEYNGNSYWIDNLLYDSTVGVKSHFIFYLKKLLILSEVAEELGYTQMRFNYIFRGKTDRENVFFYIYNMEKIRIAMRHLGGFTMNEKRLVDKEQLKEEIVSFEKEYATLEGLESLPEKLRDAIVKGDIE